MAIVPLYSIEDFTQVKEDFFYANILEDHLKTHLFVNAPHKHSTFIAILFTAGTGKHYIDFESYEILPGSIFLLSPGQVHSWEISSEAKGFVFFHTQTFYDSIFLNKKIAHYPFFFIQQNYPAIYLTPAESEEIATLFAVIYQEFHAEKSWKMEKIQLYTDAIYIELARRYKTYSFPEGAGNYYDKVKTLQKLIDQEYKTLKSPAAYADKMHMTGRHLSRIVKETLKTTLTDMIQDRIMLEAKRLLIYNTSTVGNIAGELGYEDVSYFIRLFKKRVGMAPREFQKSIHQAFK